MSKERTIQTLSLDGNCLCFDFINTLHDRSKEAPFEYLSSYQNVMEWCRRLEAMPGDRIDVLSAFSDVHHRKAETVLERMIATREMLYRFFSQVAADKPVEKTGLEKFNQEISDSLAKLRFAPRDGVLQLDWNQEEPDLKEPLWRVMKSAYDVLTEESFDRIKECEACGWIFLDQSKNKSRRWCSMQACGSIHKAKKYYHRKKKEESNGG